MRYPRRASSSAGAQPRLGTTSELLTAHGDTNPQRCPCTANAPHKLACALCLRHVWARSASFFLIVTC